MPSATITRTRLALRPSLIVALALLPASLPALLPTSAAAQPTAAQDATTARSAPPRTPGCELHFHVTPRHDTTPRRLDIRLDFPAGGRRQTTLGLAPGWAGINDFHAALHDWRGDRPDTRVQPGDAPHRWTVEHPAQGEVSVHYRVRAALADPDDGQPQPQFQLYRPQVGADWFQFFGHGALALPEGPAGDTRAALCVTLAQPGQPQAPAIGTLHAGRGEEVSARLHGEPGQLHDAFYGGGPGWRVLQRALAGGPLHVAVRGQYAVGDAAFADQAAALIDSHRRFWGETSAPPQWLVLTPNHARGNAGGTLVRQAAVLHAGPEFSPASGSFEFLIGHENLHSWIPGRFGSVDPDPVAQVRGYWFSEGFTNYYTHRLLLASGLWTLDRYADNLSRVLQDYWRSPARQTPVADIAPRFFTDRRAGQQMYIRGELLALRWDDALRDRGHPGLDTVLRPLMRPAGVDGPGGNAGSDSTDRPEPDLTTRATHRVLTALEPLLGALPARDLAAHIDRGEPLPLAPGLGGPCLRVQWEDLPRWSLGFDEASFGERVARSVRPGGPAHQAGLRDGQALRGWSVYGNDVGRDVELWVVDDAAPSSSPEKLRTLRYRPVDGTERLPTARVRDGAADDPACIAWQRR